MRTLFDKLTSRRTSMALIAFVACAAAVGAIIPQRTSMAPAAFAQWQADNPQTARIVVVLGLDRVFSAWWFLIGLGVFGLALGIATVRMARSTWRKSRVTPTRPTSQLQTSDIAGIRERARRHGFRERPGADGVVVFERHAAGIWGPVVLHAGLVVAVVAGLVASGATSRAVMDLSVGEVRNPGDRYLDVERGVAGSIPELGAPVRLDALDTSTWEDGSLRSVTGTLSVQDESGGWRPYPVTARSPTSMRGRVVYLQAAEFGEATFLEITGPAGAQRRRMEFAFTPAGEVSYADVIVDGSPIEGRWDPSLTRADKPLALRVSDTASTPVALAKGETASVGPYTVTFAEKGRWARFVVVGPQGVAALFVGFGIISLGSMMLYLWVPRRLTLGVGGADVTYRWSAGRMGSAFDDERDALLGLTETENRE